MGADERARRSRLEQVQAESRRLRELLADPGFDERLAQETAEAVRVALATEDELSVARDALRNEVEQLRLDSMAARRRRAEREALRTFVRAFAFLAALSASLGTAILLAKWLALPTAWLGALAGAAGVLASVETFQLGARLRGAATSADATTEQASDTGRDRATPGRSRSP